MDEQHHEDLGTAASASSVVGAAIGAPAATITTSPALQPERGGASLRDRLGIALIGRLGIATVFLAAALAGRVFAYRAETLVQSQGALFGAAVAVALTLVSIVLARRVRRLVAFATLQSILDVLLITGAIVVVSRSAPGPVALLYVLAIANAAGLLLRRGAVLTALAASLAHLVLLQAAYPSEVGSSWVAAVGAPALTVGCVLLGIAYMMGTIAQRVAVAEEELARRDEEVGHLEGVQRALANDLECGLLIVDATGRVRSANPAAQHVLGLSLGAILGRAVSWLIPTLEGAEQERGLEPGALGEAFVECDLRASDGSLRRLRVKRTQIADTFGNTTGELVLLQDLTKILELEERIAAGEDAGLVLGESEEDAESEGEAEPDADGIVGTCPAMRAVAKVVAKVAQTDATVLVTGESGTGKELIAQAIHRRSDRSRGPFVVVNCGAIPENLIESELFGHVKGAFTGAVADRPGLFRRAHGGTIFLDEIGELPLNLQVRLLRVLQDHNVMPVGASAQVAVDVRVVAATNRVLEDQVKAGRFREDLYYRLAVISIPLPALRERGVRDLEKLISFFVRGAAERHGKGVARVSARAMHLLSRYAYPGNVRELENVIEHATTLCDGETIREADLPEAIRDGARPRPNAAPPQSTAARIAMGDSSFVAEASPSASSPYERSDAAWNLDDADGSSAVLLPVDEGEGLSLDDQLARREKAMLLAALARADGVKKRAASLLGINYRSFRHRLQKYGLDGHESDMVGRIEPPLPRERAH